MRPVVVYPLWLYLVGMVVVLTVVAAAVEALLLGGIILAVIAGLFVGYRAVYRTLREIREENRAGR